MLSPSDHSPPQLVPSLNATYTTSRLITGSLLGSTLQGGLRSDGTRLELKEAAEGDDEAGVAVAEYGNQGEDADVG